MTTTQPEQLRMTIENDILQPHNVLPNFEYLVDIIAIKRAGFFGSQQYTCAL